MAISTYYNRIKYTPTLGGLGDFVTGSSITGFRTPAGASALDGAIVAYVAFSSDQSEWETGQGIYTVATTTLARTTVRESSNANAKVNFTAAPTVAWDLQAQDLWVMGVASATSLALGGATIGTNALAVTGTALFNSSLTTIGATLLGNNVLMINSGTGLVINYNNGAYGWASGALTITSGTVDTNISRNAAGIIQIGTTAANAAGAWLAAKGTLTGGTLADQATVLSITATQPASPSATQKAIGYTITGAGSASQVNKALDVTYAAGYTGSSLSLTADFQNGNAGTGNSAPVPAAGTNYPTALNASFLAETYGVTTGTNVGAWGVAQSGIINVGMLGLSQVAKNSGTNIGVVGSAVNTGTTPVHIGGFFSLNQTTAPTVSAALIADNGAQTDAIFLARDNGSTVFTIQDGGNVVMTGSELRMPISGALIWGARGSITNSADGVIRLNNDSLNGFDRLQFGGTTSSFPAIKRSTTALQVRLADDSADAGITMSTITASGITSITNATDSTTTTSGALQVAGGMAVRKRIFADGLTASAGLQTSVICQSSAGELIADSVACLASSERFKTILGTAEAGAIDKISRVPIHRWKYKEEGIFQSENWTREHIGPTAEEIEAIDSRLVGYDNEGKARNISQEQLLALAIQAIQELNGKVDELKAMAA